jgi:hypothetical protein
MFKRLCLILLCLGTVSITSPVYGFTDTTNATQHMMVTKLANDQIINGYPNGSFQPNQPITRAQASALLARAVKIQPVQAATNFLDVPATHPYYNDIQQLSQANIVNGDGTYFYPDKPMTRGELAKVLALTFTLASKTSDEFKDVAATHPMNAYIGALTFSNFTTGYPDQTFRPQNNVTRGEFATFIYRALYGKEITIEPTTITDFTRFAPTKLAGITSTIYEFKESFPFTFPYKQALVKVDTSYHSTTIGKGFSFRYAHDLFLYGQANSDYILTVLYPPITYKQPIKHRYELGFRNDEIIDYYQSYTIVHSFYTPAAKFNGVTKITLKPATKKTATHYVYFKEGFGLIKHSYSSYGKTVETTLFELTHFELQ